MHLDSLSFSLIPLTHLAVALVRGHGGVDHTGCTVKGGGVKPKAAYPRPSHLGCPVRPFLCEPRSTRMSEEESKSTCLVRLASTFLSL